jgi:hypothetical protein
VWSAIKAALVEARKAGWTAWASSHATQVLLHAANALLDS